MLIARDIAYALDASKFAERCGIAPDPWQADLLRSRPKRGLLLCSRQSGKSTVTALLALHTAIYVAAALVVIASPSQRQSAEMLRTTKNLYSAFSEDGDALEMAAESVLRVELRNGSRIIALPGTERTVRGLAAATLVVIDEASRVEDALIQAVRPMVATSNGSIIALTTPAGKRGWFYEAWTGSDPVWHRVRVSADQCPRISEEFLAEELRALGQARFSEEYQLQFLDDQESAFPAAIINRAFDPELEPLW